MISKVTGPTAWCTGMVVIPKQTGDIRICMDLKPLNESVLWETSQVDETFTQLAGAAIFSKLDTNSGFWQIPLSAES